MHTEREGYQQYTGRSLIQAPGLNTIQTNTAKPKLGVGPLHGSTLVSHPHLDHG